MIYVMCYRGKYYLEYDGPSCKFCSLKQRTREEAHAYAIKHNREEIQHYRQIYKAYAVLLARHLGVTL